MHHIHDNFFFAVKLCTSHQNLVVDSDNVINIGRDKTANISFHDFDNQFGFDFFIFFLVSASSENVF